MAARTALVTGANGFVGCHVVRALTEAGCAVRAMVRRGADQRALDGVACTVVHGDLCDPSSLVEAARGCDEIYHVAADYRLWVEDETPMYAANVEGTCNIIEVARKLGVHRLVHTSTVGTLGIGADGIGREDTPVNFNAMVGPYKRSKFLAEQEALKAARAGVPIVIVNPSTPIGAFDFKPTPTGRIVVDFLNGRMPAFIDTGLNLVCAEDVARGHLLAAARGRIGEKYILGAENLTLAELLRRLAQLAGRRAPRLKLPYAVAYAYALGAEAVARGITHRAPRASITEVRMARKRMFFDSAKARSELGYTPGAIDAGLQRAIDFFRSCGMVRSRQ
ncbi:MAG TPA: hopanoid-associated sugar epimerase [Candidatus Binataceae bacterium]|jgi:dihydroflavonol-4-reductase|nr:hopanoid-associated sugar epimerase [Candidatus Binataceae bacterium]